MAALTTPRLSIPGSIEFQMDKIENLRTTDSSKFIAVFQIGDELIEYSKTGELRKFIRLFQELDDIGLYFYFIVKAFMSAISHGNLMIASYIIDQGYPINSLTLPNPVVTSLTELDDLSAVSVVEFLICHQKMDINYQVYIQ